MKKIKKFGDFINENINEGQGEFKIVYGDEIMEYYSKKQLNRSVQRTDRETMSLFSSNDENNGAPSHIGLLVYENGNDLLGRALVWFNSVSRPRGKTFMDKVYCDDPNDNYEFTYYAKQNGWLYRADNISGEFGYNGYVDPNIEGGRRVSKHPLIFSLIPGDYEKYPYLDSLTQYNPDTGEISTTDGSSTYNHDISSNIQIV